MVFFDYNDFPLLSVLVFTPLVGSVFVMSIPKQKTNNIQNCALWVSIFTFLLAMLTYFSFDESKNEFQCVEKYQWIARHDIFYGLGIDNLSVVFVLLISSIFPVAIILSFFDFQSSSRARLATLLALETGLLGGFCSTDVLLFYIFLETTLFGFLFMLQTKVVKQSFWGITILSSVIILIGLLKISNLVGASSFEVIQYELSRVTLDHFWSLVILLALLARFVVVVNRAGITLNRDKSTAFSFYVLTFSASLFCLLRIYPIISSKIAPDIVTVIPYVLCFFMFVQLLRWRREIPQAFPDEEMPKVDEAGSLLGKKTDEQTLDQRMLQHLPFAVEIICYFILITVIINYQSTENDSTLMLTDAFPTHMIFAYINYCFIIPTLLLLSVIFYSINRLISVAILSYLVFSCPGLPGSCGFLGHVFTVCNPNISPPQILLYITGLIGFTWIFSHIFVSSLHRRFIGSSSGVLIEKRMKIICLGTIAFLLCVLLTLGTVQWIPS